MDHIQDTLVLLTSNHHDYYGVDFLVGGVGSYVAEAHRRQSGEGEIHGRDVSRLY